MTTINKMSYTPQIIELSDGIKCVSLDDFRKLERELEKLRNITEIAIRRGKGEVGFPDWGFICEEFYKLKEGANDTTSKPTPPAESPDGEGLGARNCWALAREERKHRFDDAVSALDRYGVPDEDIVSALEVLADLLDDEAHGRAHRAAALVANAGASESSTIKQAKCREAADYIEKLERELAEAREQWGTESMNAAQFLSEKTKAMSELEKAQNQLSQIHRWIERHNQDGFIDSLTYPQNLDRCVDALYDKLEIAIARKQ